MYLLASAARGLVKGHSHRLSRVTTTVSYCNYLVAQTACRPDDLNACTCSWCRMLCNSIRPIVGYCRVFVRHGVSPGHIGCRASLARMERDHIMRVRLTRTSLNPISLSVHFVYRRDTILSRYRSIMNHHASIPSMIISKHSSHVSRRSRV
jgi:hypothetical protein